MALGNLAGFRASTQGAWNQAAADKTSPLAKMEEQRRRNVDEGLAGYDAKTKRISATASQSTASTAASKEKRLSAEAEAIKKRMAEINAVHAPEAEPGTPEYEREAYKYASVLAMEEIPEIQEMGMKHLEKMKVQRENVVDPTSGQSMGAMRDEAELARTQAEASERTALAEAATAGVTIPMKPATSEDLKWAANVIAQEPRFHDFIPWNEISPQAQGQLAKELADVYNQVKRENIGSPEQAIANEAIKRFALSKGIDLSSALSSSAPSLGQPPAQQAGPAPGQAAPYGGAPQAAPQAGSQQQPQREFYDFDSQGGAL
jgi:hypothetical protein